jgi:hypothetical protein
MTVITTVEDKTLAEVLAGYKLKVDAKSFLDLNDLLSNSTNWERIKRKYSIKELADNQAKYPSSELLVKTGTKLEMRTSFIKRDIFNRPIQDIFDMTSFKPFMSAELAGLLKDPKYSRSVTSYSGEQIATIMNNEVTVYIWCRALSAPNSVSQEGAWLNVSAFIQSLTTQKSEIGSFSFTLPPVACQWDEFNGWQLSSDVIGYKTGSVDDDVLSTTMLQKYNPRDPGYYWREKFLFNTVLQANDLVYIRFEKLEADADVKKLTGSLSQCDIPDHIYDMIGLIDDVSLSTSPRNVNINITGRDLMKILIEDGSYFFPEQFAQNIFTNEDSILTKRNKIELEIQSLSGASYTFKSIQVILKFIFNKFSNIGIITNSALNGYGDRAIRDKYQLKTSELQRVDGPLGVVDQLNAKFLKEDRQGIWRICEFIFDPQVANRVLADNSVSQDNGSIINSIKKVCQEPFVEFYGDTYRDKFYFIVRKQPFDEKGYKGLVYDNVFLENPTTSNNNILGIDDKQKDATRKKIDIERRLSLSGRASALSDLVIDIDDVDVLGEPQLSYHDEAYSWYRVIPRGLGIIDEATAFELAPIVPFDEYAEIWGNKMYSIEYNYAPSEYLQDSGFESSAKYAETQTFYDLQFLVQSNQYLPFTRRGTITLTGNRTIKRGLFIFFKPTREVFYVDGVTHNRSIDNNGNNRSTVLSVSRGMREPYIKGKLVEFPSGPKLVSYFSIINTSIANNASINNKDFLKNWRVDKDLFNFFVQRRQWVD